MIHHNHIHNVKTFQHGVSCHDQRCHLSYILIAAIWVAFFSRWQRYPCQQGCAVFHDSYRFDVLTDTWSRLPSPPFPVVSGGSVVLRERFIVLLGTAETMSFRVGNVSTKHPPQLGAGHNPRPVDALDAALGYWSGYVRATARSAAPAALLISHASGRATKCCASTRTRRHGAASECCRTVSQPCRR